MTATERHIAHVNLAKGFSGGERQTLNLIRTLSERGLRQTLIARPDSPLLQQIDQLNANTSNPVSCVTVRHNLRGHLLSRLLGRLPRPDLFHAHDGKAVYWCALHSRLSGIPYLITRRVDNPLSPKRTTEAAYLGAQVVVCLSRAIEHQVQRLSTQIATTCIPSSFSHLPHNQQHSAKIRERYNGKYLVGQVGKLIEHKGFHITIDAARQLAARCPQLHFLMLGAGDKETELKAQASGLSNVSFLGHRNDIADHLAALDLLVFPSLSEGLGSTILEAMAHQVPVIGSEAGGIPDLICHGQTGLLVPPGDSTKLAQAIEQLYQHPEQCRQLVEQASQQLAGFSPEAVADRYQALYQQLLQGQPPR